MTANELIIKNIFLQEKKCVLLSLPACFKGKPKYQKYCIMMHVLVNEAVFVSNRSLVSYINL